MKRLRMFLRNRGAVIGASMVLSVCLAALVAHIISPYDPMELAVSNRVMPPSPEHPLGTDELGRDVLSRIIHASRLALLVGFSVMLISSGAGIVIGLVAGYLRRWDNLLMRIMDGIMAFPGTLLAIAVMAALGPQVGNVIIALSVVRTPRMARVVRGQVLVLREVGFVEAARAGGSSDWRIMLRHILPNCSGPITVQATYAFAYAILREASLTFLGVGVPPTVPSWGGMLSEGRYLISKAPWLTIYPGVAIFITVMGLNLLGDGLRDMLDPRLRDA
ncbi:MAG: ABC transporter permease [Bacillota bacterium]|nr:ABC transporter permease [Bacillota bacterium]